MLGPPCLQQFYCDMLGAGVVKCLRGGGVSGRVFNYTLPCRVGAMFGEGFNVTLEGGEGQVSGCCVIMILCGRVGCLEGISL